MKKLMIRCQCFCYRYVVAAVLIALAFSACKKVDRYQQSVISADFFKLPASASEEAKAIRQYLLQEDRQNPYSGGLSANYGMPQWASMVVHGVSSGDSNFLLPLLQKDSKEVLSFIQIVKNKTTGYKASFYTKSSYLDFEFSAARSGTSTQAEKFIYKYLLVNNAVFGYVNFDVLDKRLFQNTLATEESKKNLFLHKKASSYGLQRMVYMELCVTVTTTTPHCGTPNYSGCNDADGCDRCAAYCGPTSSSSTQCEGWWQDDGTGSGGTPPGGGSGGGGGGGGTPDPCANNVVNPQMNKYPSFSLQSAVVPPPPGCPGSGGVTPTPPPTTPTPVIRSNDPCVTAWNNAVKMDSLFIKAGVQKKFDSINVAIQTVEKGFHISKTKVVNPQNPRDIKFKNYVSRGVGTGTDSSVSVSETLPYLQEFAGWAHSHPAKGYPAPSAKDIYNLIESFTNQDFYEGDFIAAANGSKYAFTVTDTAAAKKFLSTKSEYLYGANWKDSSNVWKGFKETTEYFLKLNKKNADKRNISYDIAMAAVLLRFDTGVTLYKQDSTGSFRPIIVKTVKSLNKKGKEVLTFISDCTVPLII